MAFQRFAHNTLFATIAGASTAVGGFVGSIIVARLLGPAGAGAVALALWIAATAVTCGDLGVPLMVSRFLPDLQVRGRSADAAALGRLFLRPVLLTTAIGCAIALALFFGSEALRGAHPEFLPFGDLPSSTWLAIGAVFVAQAIGNYGMSLLRGEQKFRLAAALAVAAFALQVASVAIGGLWFGVEGTLLGYAAAGLLPGIVALRRTAAGTALDPRVRRRAWTFSLHSWGLGLISAIVWSRTELAFLSNWRGVEEAGYYAVAITLALIASQLPALATGGLLPLFTERYGSNDHAALQRAFAKATRFMALLLFPASLGMAAVAPALLPLFFGHHFEKASDVATLLVAAQGFGVLSAVSTNLLLAAERSRFLVQIGIGGALAILLAGVTIIPAFGLMGAAATRALIQLSLAAASFVFAARKLDCPVPMRSLTYITLGSLACACAARLIVTAVPTAFGLALAIVSGAGIYAVCLRLFAVLPEEDLAQIASLVARLPATFRPALLSVVEFFDTSASRRRSAKPPATPCAPRNPN
jgi:O-antigen/teichoic acid export membrane protein